MKMVEDKEQSRISLADSMREFRETIRRKMGPKDKMLSMPVDGYEKKMLTLIDWK